MKSRQRKYWIITASRDHVRKGVEGGFAQVCHGKSSPLKRMKTGDYVIYYSSKMFMHEKEKCQQFTALGTVTNDKIYQFEMNSEFQPYRLDIDFFETNDVPIKPIIEDLDFIPNKKKWGYPFRWGILEINKHDFNLISKLMLDGKESEVSV